MRLLQLGKGFRVRCADNVEDATHEVQHRRRSRGLQRGGRNSAAAVMIESCHPYHDETVVASRAAVAALRTRCCAEMVYT